MNLEGSVIKLSQVLRTLFYKSLDMGVQVKNAML